MATIIPESYSTFSKCCYATKENGVRRRAPMQSSAGIPLERCSALVLNADYRPLSYYPLSIWSWQDAVKAIFRGSVDVVSEYERTVRSPHLEMKLPSVLALKEYVHTSRTPAFTRFNVFLRDRWTCQYCGHRHKTHELNLRSCYSTLQRRTYQLGEYRCGLSLL